MPNFDKPKLIEWAKKEYDYESLSYEATQAFTGWDVADGTVFFGKIREVISVLEKVIDIIEKFSKDVDSLSGKSKLDAAVDFVDDLVKFNFLLEMVDGVVIKMVLSTIVTQKNRWFGQDWHKDEIE